MRLLLVIGVIFSLSAPALAADSSYPKGVQVVHTGQPFIAYIEKIKKAITANKMGIVGIACATCGAKAIGETIAGNRVIMIFNPHYAVRMLNASIPAGVEAPLRLYVVEDAQGAAVLSYKKPSQIFAPYGNADLDAMASELDQIVKKIIADAPSHY